MNPSLPFGCMSSIDETRFCFYETKDTIFIHRQAFQLNHIPINHSVNKSKEIVWPFPLNNCSRIVERARNSSKYYLCEPSWCEGPDECLGSSVLPSSSPLGRYLVSSVRQTIFVMAAIRPVPPCTKLSHFLTIQEEQEKENLHKNNLIETALLSTYIFHARPLVVVLVWRYVAKMFSHLHGNCFFGNGQWKPDRSLLLFSMNMSVCLSLFFWLPTRPFSPWPYCVTHSSTCMLGSLPYSESFDLTRIGSHLI